MFLMADCKSLVLPACNWKFTNMSKIINKLHLLFMIQCFYFICQISIATSQSFFSNQCKEQMALKWYVNGTDFGMK